MQPDETTLMLQVREGQLDKLALLFERNHVALFNYFLRVGNSRAVSEDLVQETFAKVLAYKHSYNGSGSFRSWLYGIARNTMADQYRGLQATSQHVEVEEQNLSGNGTLQEGFEQSEQQQLFEQALAALPAESRDILVLSRYQQLNYDEISEMMGVNLNTFKSRMRKAIAMLKDNFAQLSGRPAHGE